MYPSSTVSISGLTISGETNLWRKPETIWTYGLSLVVTTSEWEDRRHTAVESTPAYQRL
jgi:hypothetical protein